MTEILRDIGLVLLGAILAFAAERLSDYYKQRQQKREAFQRLDRMLETVKQAVGHGHDFKNKGDWSTELDALAKADQDWLDQLYEPLKRIAWQVRDQSFDHGKSDAAVYCCDELILDLALLQLKLLPLIPMKSQLRQAAAKRLASQAVLCWQGVLLGDPTEHAEKFLKQWNEGKVTVDKKFAMSSVLGTGEKSSAQ
jgi:hypothetical protein